MPMLAACPNSKCNHPGPLGFNGPVPWGLHVYHGRECPGAWSYGDKWYDTEAEAWEQYKRDNPHLNPNWVKAFDAKIIRHNERSYKYWIRQWEKDCEREMNRQLPRRRI